MRTLDCGLRTLLGWEIAPFAPLDGLSALITECVLYPGCILL